MGRSLLAARVVAIRLRETIGAELPSFVSDGVGAA